MVRLVAVVRLGLVVSLCLVVTAAEAQKTEFNPGIQLSAGYNSNLGFGGNVNPSDYFRLLQVYLPVYRNTRTQQLLFQYRPRLFRYDEFTQLDRDEHDLSFGLSHRYANRNRLRFEVRWITTQVQGDAASIDDTELFLDQRSDRQLFRGRFDWHQPFARRWFWRANVIAASADRCSAASVVEMGPPPGRSDRMAGLVLRGL